MTAVSKDVSADLGLVLLAAIWGVNFSVVKVVLEELGPLSLNALRFPIAAAALWVLLRGRAGPTAPSRQDLPRIVSLGLIGNVAYQLCFIFSIDATRAGNASLILATTPVWIVILSALVGHERPTRWVVAGVLGTLLGMTLVVLGRGDEISLGSATLRGDLLMVAAAMLWSVYTVGGHRLVARYGALRMTSWTLWIGTPCLVAIGARELSETDLTAISVGAWLGVAYAGLFSIGLAYLLWYRGVQRLGNSRTAVYSNLVPIAALTTAWLWLGEVPTGIQILGAVVILAGLTLARITHVPDPSSRRWRISGNS